MGCLRLQRVLDEVRRWNSATVRMYREDGKLGTHGPERMGRFEEAFFGGVASEMLGFWKGLRDSSSGRRCKICLRKKSRHTTIAGGRVAL